MEINAVSGLYENYNYSLTEDTGCRVSGKNQETPNGSSEKSPEEVSDKYESKGTDSHTELTDDEKKQVQELKKRDAQVKAHEQAHVAAGGSYVRGGASYEYTRGPDGRQYAAGGEVSIDTGAIPGEPEATIKKMQTVRRAAMAPVDPSPQDRAVASQASQTESKARAELAKNKTNGDNSDSNKEENSKNKQGTYGMDSSINQEYFCGKVMDIVV